MSILDDETCAQLFSKSFTRELSGYRTTEVISKHMASAPTNDVITAAQYVDLKTWLVGDILTKVDRTAMACGLEVRVPMLNADFVRWSLGLPSLMKLSGKNGKRALKLALEPLLSHEVLYRRKQGFSMPLASWFRGAFGAEFARDLRGSANLEEYLDVNFVQHMLLSHRRGWSDNSRALWLVWMFKGFLDQVHEVPAGLPGRELASQI